MQSDKRAQDEKLPCLSITLTSQGAPTQVHDKQ